MAKIGELYRNILGEVIAYVDRQVATGQSRRQAGIGKAFQRTVSADIPLPPDRSQQYGNQYALLKTNETLAPSLRDAIRSAADHPDGYVVGIGCGNIFRMIELFPQHVLPKAVIATDVIPEVVLAGRVVNTQLQTASDPEHLVYQLKHLTDKQMNTVLQKEPNRALHARLAKAARHTQLQLAAVRELRPSHQQLPQRRITEVIADNFSQYQQLAGEENMAMTLADITNPAWIRAVQSLPQLGARRNVVYLSNAIDHITDRGRKKNQYTAFSPLEALGGGKKRGNRYIDTTQWSLRYHLRAGYNVPIYTRQDFI